jgi:hypothetical protein
MKSKRKRRNKIDKDKVDTLVPIDISIFGSEDDPCFGKLYDPTAKECGMCGDSSICAIVSAQNQHSKRALVEKKTSFKDIEIEIENNYLNLDLIRLHLEKRIKKKKKVRFDDTVDRIKSLFDKNDEFTKKKVREVIINIVKIHPNMKLIKYEKIKYIKWTKEL